MTQQVRCRISDEAHAMLTTACAEQACTQGEVITAALLSALGPQEPVVQTPVVLALLQQQTAMLMALMKHAGCWVEAKPEASPEAPAAAAPPHLSPGTRTAPVSSSREYYHNNGSWLIDEPGAEAHMRQDAPGEDKKLGPPTKVSLWRRAFVKE